MVFLAMHASPSPSSLSLLRKCDQLPYKFGSIPESVLALLYQISIRAVLCILRPDRYPIVHFTMASNISNHGGRSTHFKVRMCNPRSSQDCTCVIGFREIEIISR